MHGFRVGKTDRSIDSEKMLSLLFFF